MKRIRIRLDFKIRGACIQIRDAQIRTSLVHISDYEKYNIQVLFLKIQTFFEISNKKLENSDFFLHDT